jgi:hypothetical protein
VLVEAGFVRATDSAGRSWSFTPSFKGIASLGSPHEIVALYVALHGPNPAQTAAYVLACLCDQDDPTDLIGFHDEQWNPGPMPAAEQVLIARHLMSHGIIGKARPGAGKAAGKFSPQFDATEYVSAARVHLGLGSADAEALSMTEFQMMMAMKFPEANNQRDIPSREEYDALMARVGGKSRG